MPKSFLLSVVIVAWLQANDCSAKQYQFFHENVLGTSMELSVEASEEAVAQQAESFALTEIERLSGVLSSYDASSEFARFVATPVGQEVALSDDLYVVLRMCDQWRHVSQDAFNPGTENLSRLWVESANEGRKPTAAELSEAIEMTKRPQWRLNSRAKTAVRLSEGSLSLNAIAKGVILDSVAQMVVARCDEVDGVMVNIGGDIRLAGQISTEVSVAHPMQDAIGGAALSKLKVNRGGVATSGASERSIQFNDATYSHIIDPRTGTPVRETILATVVAPKASTADVLATVCGVLSTRESLALVNSMPGVECLLYSATGMVAMSTNWPAANADPEVNDDSKGKAKSVQSTGHEMRIDFEISSAGASRRYRRPYVAVWVEDKDKFPVKTLSLFLMQNDPGPRWYRDVRRWYSDDQLRKLVDDTDMIGTVSKPTRNPGKYKVVWDGRDDSGKLVKEGKYTVLIEAAREHGTYQLIKQEFEFGKSLRKKLKGNLEISAASIDYSVKK